LVAAFSFAYDLHIIALQKRIVNSAGEYALFLENVLK